MIIGEAQNQPHNINTERAVLATLARYNDLYMEHSNMLTDELFYYQHEQNLFHCITGVIQEGHITDIRALTDFAVKKKINLYEDDFVNLISLSDTKTFQQDIERLTIMSRQRKCWIVLQEAAKKVLDPTLDLEEEITGCLKSLSDIQTDTADKIADFSDAVDELQQIINDNAQGKKVSLHTGFKLFDEYYLLRPTTLTVIAGFTSAGKSALAMNVVMNIAKQNIPSAYYSLEMGKVELAARGVSKDTGLTSSTLMNRKLEEWELKQFDKAIGIKNLPIYFDDRNTVTFEKTINSIRAMVKQKQIKLAVIDYLQIYSQVADNVESNLGYMARVAKNIAKETGIAVILLSQLNRSGLHPNIKMLRGSGQIEESADNIVLIDRPEAYPDNKVTKYEGEFEDQTIQGTAKLILSKGRGVGTGCALVGFDGRFTQFYELDDNSYQAESNAPF